MDIITRMTDEVEAFEYPTTKKADFDAFWDRQVALCRRVPLETAMEPSPCPYDGITARRVSYKGIDGVTVRGLYLTHDGAGKRPCMVLYPGYMDYSGFPTDYAHWLMLGINFFVIDARDQNASTGNTATDEGFVNVLTKGITSPETYYFRFLYTDAYRAVEVMLEREENDPDRIIIMGGSQGGSLTMAVAALHDRIWMAMADIPSNCCFDLRLIHGQGNFIALQEHIKRYPERLQIAADTLSYFDHVNLAERITCPIWAMVGLKDGVCPAKYYYAAYRRIPGEKHIRYFPFAGHEHPRDYNYEKIALVKRRLSEQG